MSTLSDRTITALRTNHDDLAARVGGFADSDLARQSGASEWDVAQVLSHLGSGAEIMLAGLRAAQAGKPAPGQDFAPSVWDRWNAMSRQEQADGFLRSDEQLVGAFEGLDDAARREVRVELGFLPEPADVTVLSGMRMNEAALHGWDVRVAFDPQATVAGNEAEIALEHLTGPLGFLVGFLARGEAPGAGDITLRVETADPQRLFGLILGDKVTLGDAPAAADGTLTGPAESVVRLAYGRLDPAHTPPTLTLDSDAVTLDQLRAVFPGI